MNALIGLVLFSLLVAGCADDTSCVLDEECFAGEACVADRCQRPADDSNAAQNDDTGPTSNMTSNNFNATNGDNAMNNATPTNNATTNNTSTNNTTTNNTTSGNNTTGACRGSAFDSCPQDDDQIGREYLNGEFSQGCPGPDDDFGAGVITPETRSMCPLEESDRYDTTVSRCQSASFFVDVEVVPSEACATTDWTLDASFDGNDCVEPNGVVDCVDLPNGGKRATFIVEPGNAFHSLYTTVLPEVDNLRFDYDLTITFRQ